MSAKENRKKDIQEWLKKENEIVKLEFILDLRLPSAYRDFLIKFGGGYSMGIPIAGVPNIYGLPVNSEPTSVLGATLFLRIKRKDLPPDFVVIKFVNREYALCLDLRKKPEKDAPLVKIHLFGNEPPEKLGQSFSEYLKNITSLL